MVASIRSATANIAVNGSNFVGGGLTRVTFGTAGNATSHTFVDTQNITVTSPASPNPGFLTTVQVTVTTPGGTSVTSVPFTYHPPVTVSGIDDAEGRNAGGETRLRKVEQRLLEAGVIVARTVGDFLKYHGKYLIIDDTLHLLGFNFTKNDLTETRSFGIQTRHARAV